ncbi:chitin deacetylase 7-like isoform X3 [Octopus vulgaris]|uniref:Chitin deacetylase 7-like isoform X3 n=1 Tax=Octopus vulgaris TaxID=6645 RepID=A0AA36ART3_OCTVU|nr:chitin deacetylase 7-like isoform X3 [Octopus vulgaris]
MDIVHSKRPDLTSVCCEILHTREAKKESCTEAGEYKCHETDDSKFYHCTGPKHGILLNCGNGLEFNPQYNVCDWEVDGDGYCKTQRDQSKTTHDVGATTKSPTKSVVTTHSVPFKRSSTLSKILSTTTSKPSTHSQTTSKPSTQSQTTSKPSTHPQTTSKPSTHSQTTSKPSTQSQTTSKPSTHPQTTSKPSTHSQITSKPSNSLKSCRKSNEYKCHETNNSLFYLCTGFETGALKTCPEGSHFNPVASICTCSNIPNAVKCHNQDDQSKTTTSKPQLTGPCQPERCKLPKCKCPGTEIPGSLPTNATPQIILLTFDDGIYWQTFDYYRNLFSMNLTNPNGCPVGATFYVSDSKYSDPALVKELYDLKHEIATHTQTHRLPSTYWNNANSSDYYREIVGMKNWLSEEASIPKEKIVGYRSPYLEQGGDTQFGTLKLNEFLYDTSMVTGSFSNTTEIPIWPFTLDYPVIKKYCQLRVCPNNSYPGFWEFPLNRWYNEAGDDSFSMTDENRVPQNSKDVISYLKYNFNRHYKRNKAPFGIFLHMAWLMKNLAALQTFLKEVSHNNDVWIVTVSQALQWIQNPVPLDKISEFRNWKC